jgi:nitroreductase
LRSRRRAPSFGAMPTFSPADVLQQLTWRYAVKRFDPAQKIPDDAWAVLEQSLHLAPSSFNLQPWKFVVVEDPELRRALRAASWNQPQVTDASHYVVFAGLRTTTTEDVDRMITLTAEARGVAVDALARYRQVIVDFVQKSWQPSDLGAWNARQVYIALGQFMTAAAMLGIDTSPLEGIDCAVYDKLLGFDGTRHLVLCACAAGYRAPDDKGATAPKARFPFAQVCERK